MPEVVVGVARWAEDHRARPNETPNSEIGAHWVQVGATRLTAAEHGLIGVRYECSGSEFARVFIEVLPSSFLTVDSGEPHADKPSEGD